MDRDGGSESFDSFYERELAPQVRRAALLVGSSDAANDVVHDAFVQIYRRWGSLENPGGYLNRTVLNGARDHARRSEVRGRVLPRLVDRASVAPDEYLDDVLMGLPFNHRAAVVLRYVVGMATAEIADELGCAPGSVGPWIDRAMSQLRKALRDD
jgi:RNA polymerase sigma factor (sigma-70 family)